MMTHMPETPLVSYLRLQRAHDRDMLAALRVAANGVDSELRRLQGRTRPGEALRREQLLRSQNAINRQLSTLFARVGDATSAAAARAAAEGAEVTL